MIKKENKIKKLVPLSFDKIKLTNIISFLIEISTNYGDFNVLAKENKAEFLSLFESNFKNNSQNYSLLINSMLEAYFKKISIISVMQPHEYRAGQADIIAKFNLEAKNILDGIISLQKEKTFLLKDLDLVAHNSFSSQNIIGQEEFIHYPYLEKLVDILIKCFPFETKDSRTSYVMPMLQSHMMSSRLAMLFSQNYEKNKLNAHFDLSVEVQKNIISILRDGSLSLTRISAARVKDFFASNLLNKTPQEKIVKYNLAIELITKEYDMTAKNLLTSIFCDGDYKTQGQALKEIEKQTDIILKLDPTNIKKINIKEIEIILKHFIRINIAELFSIQQDLSHSMRSLPAFAYKKNLQLSIDKICLSLGINKTYKSLEDEILKNKFIPALCMNLNILKAADIKKLEDSYSHSDFPSSFLSTAPMKGLTVKDKVKIEKEILNFCLEANASSSINSKKTLKV